MLGVLGGNWGALLAARAAGKLGPLGAAGKHWVAAGRLLGAAKGHRWALWGAGGAGGGGAAPSGPQRPPAAPAPSVLIEETNRVTKMEQIASRKIEQMPGVESRDRHADGDLKMNLILGLFNESMPYH